jgi:hypothetical protein
VQIEGQSLNAVLTIVRLGPFNVVRGDVLDFWSLDFGSRGVLEAPFKGPIDATGFAATPPRPATSMASGTVLNGTGQFAIASGAFFIFLSNDGKDTKVDLNGKLCDDTTATATTPAVTIASQTACKNVSITQAHLPELFDSSGNRLGAKGPARVQIEGQTFDAVVTVARLGPFNVTGGEVTDYVTLDLGSRGVLEVPFTGVFDASGFSATPRRSATFIADGPVLHGTAQFTGAIGSLFLFLSNDGKDTAVDLNGKLCHVS